MALCRLCYKDVVNGRDLFTKSKIKPGGYAKDLFYALQIEIQKKPNWPSMACRKCLDMIREIKNFRTLLEGTQLMLTHIYDKPRVEAGIESAPEGIPAIVEPPIVPPLKAEEQSLVLDETSYITEEIVDYEENFTALQPADESIEQQELEEQPVIKKQKRDSPPIEPQEMVEPFPAETALKDEPILESAPSPVPDDDRYDSDSESSADDLYTPQTAPKVVEKTSRALRFRPRVTRAAAKANHGDEDSDFEIPLPKRKMKKKKVLKVPETLTGEAAKKFRMMARLNMKYPNREELEEVLRSLKILNCHVCEMEMSSYADLCWHVEGVHKMARYTAYVTCCQGKHDLYSIYDHALYHLNQSAFQCPECEKNFGNKIRLNKHLARAHIPANERWYKFQCEKCGRGYDLRKTYQKHMKLHSFKFDCSKCQEPFQTEEQMLDHIDFVHKKIFRHICDICAAGFNNAGILYSHIKRHFMKKPMWEKCDECNLHFANVKVHKKNAHGEERKKTCKICSKVYSIKYINRHMAMVHEQSTMVGCTLCGRQFKSQTQLKAHMDIHQGIRYDCHFCSMTYGATSNRSKHMIRKHPFEYEEWKKARSREIAEQRNETITKNNSDL